MTQMWLGDNCHTYDRKLPQAQQDCGVGQNKGILKTANKLDFDIKYFPYIQNVTNHECM